MRDVRLTVWDLLYGVLWGFVASVLVSVLVLASGCYRAWGEGQPRTEEHAGVLRGGTDPAGGPAWWLDADDGVTYRLAFEGKVPVSPAALRALKGRRAVVTHRRGAFRVGPLTFLLVRSVGREP